MKTKNQKALRYINDKLYFEDLNIKIATEKFRTPFYLYSEKELEKNVLEFVSQAKKLDHDFLICYALKANPNNHLLNLLKEHNIGVDIVSAGELERALEVEIPSSNIIFSGVGKQDYEIGEALDKGILSINIESIEELRSINRIAKEKGMMANIGLRFNPQVETLTHKYISTGSGHHKFGMSHKEILEVIKEQQLWSNCNLIGLSIHIGSQLMELNATARAINKLSDLSQELKIDFDFLDVGGGLGVDYLHTDCAPAISDYIKVINTNLKAKNFKRIILEPGRRLIASSGIFVSKVIRSKSTSGHNFMIIDGGMNDFARPSLYGATHMIYPSRSNGDTQVYDVVGPVCETADTFASGLELPSLMPNEFLILADAGAYGRSMSSTYNLRKLPGEILYTKEGELLDITPP